MRASIDRLGDSLGLVVLALVSGSNLACHRAAAAEPDGEITGTVSASVEKQRENTVVWVKNAGAGTANGKAIMDQRGLLFLPRVLPIQKGTTVEFNNFDTVSHNVFTPDGDKYDLGTFPKGEIRTKKFETAGVFRQLCHLHSEMAAFIVVVDTKYFAISDKKGAFKIPALPPGQYTLGIWHEKLGAKDATVKVEAGKAATVEIKLEKK